jgi:hypothetical protein
MGQTLLGVGPLYQDTNFDFQKPVTVLSGGTLFLELQQKFTGIGRAAGTLKLNISFTLGFQGSIQARLYTDNAGSPGTEIARSVTQNIPTITSTAPISFSFDFTSQPNLTSGTSYWFGVYVLNTSGTTATAYFEGDTLGSVNIARRSGPGVWTVAAEEPLVATLTAADPPVVGLWDWRFAGASGVVQFYGAACDGKLFAGNPSAVDAGGSWGNPIWAAGNTNRYQLWDSVMFGNGLAVTDHAANFPRWWDGIFGSARSSPYGPQADADSTMRLGYKSPMTVANGAGMSSWSFTGLVQVIIATKLRSGGYRATYGFATIAATTDIVRLSGLAVNTSKDQFYFDILSNATTVFCTQPGRGVFYKVPAANLSVGANPIPNSTTTVDIIGMPDATLAAQDDIETATGYPTGYFTRQIATPKVRYIRNYANSLVMAGDPTAPFALYFSALNAPNVFGEYGSGYGERIDISPLDGEPITGLAVAFGSLYVFKPHNVYRVTFTGDTANPWKVEYVQGIYGTSSHWSIQNIPQGLAFMDDSGPAVCYGLVSQLLPGAQNIQNLFASKGAEENLVIFDGKPIALPALKYCSSCVEPDYTRISWALGTGTSETAAKNVLLVYDWSRKAFTVRMDGQQSVLAAIGDQYSAVRLWNGGYSNRVYRMRADYIGATQSVFETPWLDLGYPQVFKDADWLYVFGELSNSSSASWTVQVYLDGPENVTATNTAPAATLSVDASRRDYAAGGVPVKLPARAFRRIKLRFFSPQNSNESNAIEGFAIEFSVEGERR